MFVNVEKQFIKSVVTSYLSQKPKYSNYFGIDLDNVLYFEKNNCLLLKVIFNTYSRIYFMSNDAVELTKILQLLSKNDIVNIPSKNNINESLLNILKFGGFSIEGVYERYYNNDNKFSKGKFIGCFANIDELNQIHDLIYSIFNPYLDHLPSKQELFSIIEQKRIFVNRDSLNNVITGVFIFTNENSKCYFNCWADKNGGGQGLFLLLNIFNYMKLANIEKSYLWINECNINVKNIYKIFGYKADGLKDYTFTKK